MPNDETIGDMHLRLPISLSAQLRAIAEQEFRTLNAQIVVALTDWLRAREIAPR